MSNIKQITLKDLRSLVDLKYWIKENTDKFAGKDIKKENMLIIIDYLRNVVKRSDLQDKSGWLEILNDLMQKQEVIDE